MRRSILLLGLLLAACAAPIVATSPSQQAVTAIELEYVQNFLVPAASYDLLPRCPQSSGGACSVAAIVDKLRAAQVRLHDTIYHLRSLSDASPQADAATLIANARGMLAAAEALIPAKGGTK
jgi:hypothetical protein